MSDTFISISFHVNEATYVRTSTYDDHAPILVLSGDPGSITIAAQRDTVTGDNLSFARALVRCAQVYLAECERLHEKTTPDGTWPDGEPETVRNRYDQTVSATRRAPAPHPLS